MDADHSHDLDKQSLKLIRGIANSMEICLKGLEERLNNDLSVVAAMKGMLEKTQACVDESIDRLESDRP